LSRYQNRPPAITRELLDAACASYFLEETGAKPGAELPRAGLENGHRRPHELRQVRQKASLS
jgi:hypothetical protein